MSPDGTNVASWLVSKTSGFLDARLSRRSFISRATIVGTAVAASGCAVVTQPGAPYTFVTDCGGGSLCRDGYTEFCCVINSGVNACPPGTAAAGWWRADYSVFCNGTRYYIDCNNWEGAGPCRCADGCGTRKVYCNHFRYGQCNEGIGGTGVIACRMVSCVPPYQLNIGCSPSSAVDNATAGHSADCARYAPPAPPPGPPPPSSPPAAEVSVGTPILLASGKVDAFVRGAAGGVQYVAFDGATWSAFSDLSGLSGSVTSRVVAVAQSASSAFVFVRADDGAFWWSRYDGSNWSTWASLGGSLTSDPAAAVNTTGVFVFGRGTDNALYWQHFDGSNWSGWSSLGPTVTSDPVAVVDSSDRVLVFVRGSDSGYWYRRFDGTTWTAWAGLSPRLTSDPAAVRTGTFVDLFGRGADNALYWQRFDGSNWSGWLSLGPTSTSDPAAADAGTAGLFTFVRGSDNAFWSRTFDGTSWSGWVSLGGDFTSDPAAVADGNNVFLFGRGNDNALHWQRFDGSTWSGWSSLGGSIASVRGATSA